MPREPLQSAAQRAAAAGRRPRSARSSAKTSAVGPSASRRPSPSTTVRSAYSVTSCMSCVTTRTVVPSPIELLQERQQLVGAGAVLPEGRLVECEHGGARDERGRRPRAGASGRPTAGTGACAPCRRVRTARAPPRCARAPRHPERCCSRRPWASSSKTVWAMNWCSGFWNTKPTRAERVRASLRPTSMPSMCTVPRGGGMTPAIAWMSVVLPAPFAPTTATNSPASHVEVDVVEHLGAAAADA